VIDRCVCLNEIVVDRFSQVAIQRADNSGTGRFSDAEWIADCDHRIADLG